MKIILSEQAKQDMDNIFEYISYDSLKYAFQTYTQIRSYIQKLKDSPYIGRYVPELFVKDYRELLYKNYRIVYEVSETENIVIIHFIIHSKRNFKSFYNTYISKN